jgi:hypothetical protein
MTARGNTTLASSVVGNEDGAHKVVADLFQGLNDIGYSIPAQGCTYWNGAAMETMDYNDLDEVPDQISSATAAAARNARCGGFLWDTPKVVCAMAAKGRRA